LAAAALLMITPSLFLTTVGTALALLALALNRMQERLAAA
jgi:hypothetical protein